MIKIDVWEAVPRSEVPKDAKMKGYQYFNPSF